MSNGQTYTVSPSSSTGATDDGVGEWTLKLSTISGGDAKVAEAFNTGVQVSAQQQLDAAKRRAATAAASWNFETVPHIFFSSTSVSERLQGVYYVQGDAHPFNTASTVVIDSRSATPITLKNLFSDEQAGLDRLSQQTKQLLAGVLGRPGPMADEPGNAPVEANFANWVPTPQGIELDFNDEQFSSPYAPGHGIPTLTIPWAAVDDLLAPGMTALRQA